MNAKSYHASEKNRLSLHTNKKRGFFIPKKLGFLKIQEGQRATRTFLVLDEKRLLFFKKLTYFQNQFEISFKNDFLILKQKRHSKALAHLTQSLCSRMSLKKVKLILKPKTDAPSCSHHHLTEDRLQLEIFFVQSSKLQAFESGLGLPSSLEVRTQDFTNYIIDQFLLQSKLSTSQSKNQSQIYFKSFINKGSQSSFESGAEVAIQDRARFSRQGLHWKKATTRFETELLDSDEQVGVIKLSVHKTNLTGRAGLFTHDSYDKKLNLSFGNWVRVLTFKNQSQAKTSKGPLGLFYLGQRDRSLNSSQKEVWVRLAYEI